MASRSARHWIWIALMLVATAWYAWPQLALSLFPVYDLVRFLSPALTQSFQSWITLLRSMIGG
jgi:hypothetical protein